MSQKSNFIQLSDMQKIARQDSQALAGFVWKLTGIQTGY